MMKSEKLSEGSRMIASEKSRRIIFKIVQQGCIKRYLELRLLMVRLRKTQDFQEVALVEQAQLNRIWRNNYFREKMLLSKYKLLRPL